jgi:hypothetical protein
MISKKHSKRSLYSVDRSIGFKFLIAGIGFFALSLVIQIAFINGTGFKEQYRQKQHQQCLDNGNSESLCNSKFPI